MTKLSVWASHHRGKARILIVLMHLLLFVLAVNTGNSLMQLGIYPATFFIYIPVLLFFAVVFLYPSRWRSALRFSKRQWYAIRKSLDFILSACFFILVCFIANYYGRMQATGLVTTAEAADVANNPEKPTAATILTSLAYRDKSTLTRTEKRILKNEFRKQLGIYAKAKLTRDDEAGKKAVFIILSIIGAIGLCVLLAGLACSIACNGSAVGAVVVGVLGLAGILWLLIFVINKIKLHQKKPAEENPT
ncbi:MAG: hypothetical protein ABI813_13580 [Bacteroidota bacterium]